MQPNRAFRTLATLALAIGTLTGCGHDTTAATAASTTVTSSSIWAPATIRKSSQPGTVMAPSPTGAAIQDGTLTIDIHTKQVTLRQGQPLRVDFGEIVPSVGDWWEMTDKPNEDILHDLGHEFFSTCPTGMAGCAENFAWHFTATNPGTTKIAFSYRSRDVYGPKRQSDITVTVQ